MFSVDGNVLLMVPGDGSPGLLHCGSVVEVRDRLLVARFTESVNVRPQDPVAAYAEVDRKFMKRPAVMHAVLRAHPELILAFLLTGEAEPAEGRNAFRVSAAAYNFLVQVGDDPNCDLLDVSATGFGIHSHSQFKVGAVLNTVLEFQRQLFTGPAEVQYARDCGGGVYRYGFHVDERVRGATLARGIAQMTAYIQREQLRRMAGS